MGASGEVAIGAPGGRGEKGRDQLGLTERVGGHDLFVPRERPIPANHNDEVYDRSIDVQVGRLRKKFKAEGSKEKLIRTERGAGYIFTAPVEPVC